MTESFEVVAMRSGASAMLDRRTGEVMHPLSGPIDEPQSLYVRPSRLEQRLRAEKSDEGVEALVVLDVGLGAGSNAIAAWTLSESLGAAARRTLHILSFDRTVAAFELALSPRHAATFGFAAATRTACSELLEHGRTKGVNTVWRTSLGELPQTLLVEPPASADIVYWDPFSPRANPELWSVAAFTALRRLCRPGATVHTYSGATATRTALLLAGFAVGFGDVLPSGRQATVAATSPDRLGEPLDGRWLDRLSRSSAPFSSDAPPDALERIARLAQFSRRTGLSAS